MATIKTPKKEDESDKMMDLNYAHPGRSSQSGKKSLQNTDEKMHSSGKKPPTS
jgi:hypothetical protein